MRIAKPKNVINLSFFMLSVIAGIIILYPHISFQSLLAQGDHGQNLHAFQQTYHGLVPYKDYWSGYGPFAPYYYSIFFHLFGENIQSVLIGQCMLTLIAGLFFFAILSFLGPPLLAVIGSIWYWAYYPDFFYTYNHTGAFTLFMAISYFTIAYIHTGKKWNIFWGISCAFLLALIRINMGLCMLAGFILSIFITDFVSDRALCKKNKLFYILPVIIVPAVLFFIYGLLVRGLPDYAIRQSFPYGNKFYYNVTLLIALRNYLTQIVFIITGSWAALALTSLVVLFISRIFTAWTSGTLDERSKRSFLLTLITALIFLCFVSHEYFLGGVAYRLTWLQPFEMLIFFIIIAFGTKALNSNTRLVFYFAMLAFAVQSIFVQHANIQISKTPSQYLSPKRAQIYVRNPPEWIQTVERASQYLESHLSDNETFLALPYEPIYYFLTGKPSPTWHVLLTEAIRFTDEQEQKMIEDLTNKNVNTIVLSNRMASLEPGVGYLGKTHLVDLYQYIVKNYEPVETFGNWNAPAGWISGHAVKILKKK